MNEALHAKEIFLRFGHERRICLIDANRKNTGTRKSWRLIGRMLVGETHHRTFISAMCTLSPASVLIILTTFDTVVLARSPPSPRRCSGYDGTIESCSQVHPTCICAETPSRLGRDVTRCLRADIRRANACTRAAGVTAGCQGIATKSARIHTHRGSRGHQ